MTSTSLIGQQRLLGLFELDPSGTILYSRLEPDGEGDPIVVGANMNGQNFFSEAAPLENAQELRRRIRAFANSEAQADNFQLIWQCEGGPLPVKVLLTRISERARGTRAESILVHIRKV